MSIQNELTIVEAAERTGLRERTFRQLVRDGKGPKARRDGLTVKFLPDHVDSWLEEYKQTAYSADAGVRKDAPRRTSAAVKKAKKPGRPAGLPKDLQ